MATGAETLPARSSAVTKMRLSPGFKPKMLDQLVVPVARSGSCPFTVRKTRVMPEAFGSGSLAVPETVTRKLLTYTPFNGLAINTVGELVSTYPPGATSRRSEPEEFEFTLATAMR